MLVKSRDWMKPTSRFSKKKLTLVEKRKRFTRCEHPWEDFEEVLDIYDVHQIPFRIVLHVIFWLGKLAIEETIDS
jgi:hypothetical protein